jgi:internalin A
MLKKTLLLCCLLSFAIQTKGQRSYHNVINLHSLCFCNTQQYKDFFFRQLKEARNQKIKYFTVGNCLNEKGVLYDKNIPELGDNLSWSKSELDTIYSIVKSIKSINLLTIFLNPDKDSIASPTQADSVFWKILSYLPTAKNALFKTTGAFLKSDTTTLWNGLTQKPISFDVQNKVTINFHFQIEEELPWDGKRCLSFPNTDTLIVRNIASSYLHPSFGMGMDQLTTLIFSFDPGMPSLPTRRTTHTFKGLPPSIGKLKNLRAFYLYPFDYDNQSEPFDVPSSFGDLEKLEVLHFYNANANFPNSVKNLKQLKKLVFHNEVKTDKFPIINPNFFKLSELDSIHVYGKTINSKHPLHLLKKLKYFSFITNSNLPKGFKFLTELTTLNITIHSTKSIALPRGLTSPNLLNIKIAGPVKKIPNTFKQLTALEFLYLQSTTLTQLSQHIGPFPNLEILTLITPNLEKVSPNLFDMPNLHYLKLVTGSIKKWANFNRPLDSLIHLYLSSTSQQFPKGFEQMPQLYQLSIESLAPNLPVNISTLKKLKILRLNNPNLKKLPESLDAIKGLQKLYVHTDSIKKIPTNWIFPELQEASFHTVQIDQFPTFLTNCPLVKQIKIGGTLKDLASICSLEFKNSPRFFFIGAYHLSDIPTCFKKDKGKYSIYTWEGPRDSEEPRFFYFQNGLLLNRNTARLNY